MSLSNVILLITIIETVLAGQTHAWIQEGVSGASRPWPMSIRLSLSSSFGEYRDGHIHAGLDIRTFGREGVGVRAVGDGVITRMRASPFGYGKALYQRLSTGETVVYAHLSEFSPALEDYLYDQQAKSGGYEVDITPPYGAFRFGKGEVVGYSGSTGVSAPHLHFEVRNIRGEPVNPLSRGWKLRDDLCPVISSVIVIPLGRGSAVGGSGFPRKIPLKRTGRCRFQSGDTLSFQGRIGIGVEVIDRMSDDSGRLAPYRVELVVDDSTIASIIEEGFNYGQTREVELKYDMGWVRRNGKKFVLLFDRDGETIPGRAFVNDGIVEQRFLRSFGGAGGGGSLHVIRVKAYDKNGNESVAEIVLASGGGAGRRSGGVRYGELPGLFIFDDLAVLDLDRVGIEKRSSAGASPPSGGPGGPDERGKEASFLAGEIELPSIALGINDGGGSLEATLVSFVRENGAKRLSLASGITLDMSPSSFYSDAFVLVVPRPEGAWTGLSDEGLSRAEERFFIGPYSLALRKGIGLSYALLHPAGGKEGFYKWDGKKKQWRYRPSTVEGDTVRAVVDEPGLYAVLSDTIPPSIGDPKVVAHGMYGTGEVYPEIELALSDFGSDIDDANTAVYIDGKRQIARWDPFSKKLFVLIRDENIIGEHELAVVASDRAGNKTAETATVLIPGSLFKKVK